MQIREVEPKDLAQVGAIAESAFKDYSEADFKKMAENNLYKFWVLERDKKIAGFLIVLTVDEKLEIIKIATHPEFRRQGVGESLINHAIRFGKTINKLGILLEVNEKNLPARALYEKLGFEQIFVRKKYYDATFDAIIEELKF